MTIQAMNTHQITIIFFYAIGGIVAAGLLARILLGRSNKLIALLPNMAVSLGILGTFLGIYLGLLDFDVTDISGSVPELLEGLKTAFSTSIAGMIASIVLKFAYEGKTVLEQSAGPVKQEDPVALLKTIATGIHHLEKTALDIREEMNDSLKKFAENVVASSTDSLVKALESVIADFNALLNELVGESFKELSAAMVKLTEWQEKYRVHVDETQAKIDTLLSHMEQSVTILADAADHMAAIDASLQHIDQSVGGLAVSGSDISAHVENLTHQNEALKQGISAIKQIGEEAKTVIPAVSTQVDNLTKHFETTVSRACETFESHNVKVGRFVEQSMKEIDQAAKTHSQSVQDAVLQIDKGLEEELTKALNSLGGSLAALSAKFVQDYQPLTEKLREVVRLSEKNNA
jgi:chromosome segregation ATPase